VAIAEEEEELMPNLSKVLPIEDFFLPFFTPLGT
jgi:hypothetical protein